MAVSHLSILATLGFASAFAPSQNTALVQEALEVGDECLEGACSFQALQLRSHAKLDGNRSHDVGLEETKSCVFVYCPHHAHDHRCEHYRKCVQSRRRRRNSDVISRQYHYCNLYHGYLTDPTVKFTGSEEIQDGFSRAEDWDWMWTAAKRGGCMLNGQGLQVGCALLCNPKCKRGQDHFHIHNKPLSTKGQTMQGYLEENVCSGAGWQQIPSSASYCRSRIKAYAKFFRYFPAVFSSAQNSGYFRERGGITVWPVSQNPGCHQAGYVLMLTTCNIEKDIFPERLR